MTMLFSISVLRAHVFDQVFHLLRFDLFPFCFDDAAVCFLLAFVNLRIQRAQNR